MKTVTRFAPSPTGLLHIGNLRAALITWLYAKSTHGQFILRIDDTDLERSKVEYIDAIKEDLRWLEIDWDICIYQSTRYQQYEISKKKLIDSGRLYPCYETEEELMIKKRILLSKGLAPIYDRSALKLTQKQRLALELKGIKPYWRFMLINDNISWIDGVKGSLSFESKFLSDPVLVRTDGTLTYNLASVIDDIEYGVTNLIRGEDHITNSALHIQIFQALSATPPSFSHIPLMNIKDKKLSKREGSFSIRELRKNGILPLSAQIFLSKIGTCDDIKISKNINNLIKEFSLTKLSKSTIQFDFNELIKFNIKLLRNLSFDEVKKNLKKVDMPYIEEELWQAVKLNINSLEELKYWYKICNEDIKTKILDKDFIKLARSLIPEHRFNTDTWDVWITNIKKCTPLRGKELFSPLRIALTGLNKGPELKYLLPIMGRDLVKRRLEETTS